MTTYTSVTDGERDAMLAEIGVGSIEELFAELPEAVRLSTPLGLPDGLPETEVYERLRELASQNADAESQHGREEVAVLLDPFNYFCRREDERSRIGRGRSRLHLLSAQGCGRRRSLTGPE